MEENIAKIINDSYFTGEITDDLREVCEDYFANPVSSSSDSELEDHESQEDATELNRSSEDVEYFNIGDIPTLEVSLSHIIYKICTVKFIFHSRV